MVGLDSNSILLNGGSESVIVTSSCGSLIFQSASYGDSLVVMASDLPALRVLIDKTIGSPMNQADAVSYSEHGIPSNSAADSVVESDGNPSERRAVTWSLDASDSNDPEIQMMSALTDLMDGSFISPLDMSAIQDRLCVWFAARFSSLNRPDPVDLRSLQ